MIEINQDFSDEDVPGTVKGDYELHHIGVLDGIRVAAVLIVVWFHFWQQSWLVPVVGPVNLDWLPRNGAVLVDMLILLSGFCLFLPYARQMVYGERTDSAASFYIRRVAKIAPSYYIAVIVAFVLALVAGEYGSGSEIVRVLVPHLTFIHNWFDISLLGIHVNGSLWTVSVVVQFYVLFPLLARLFMKKPFWTYWGMTAVGLLSSFLISHNFDTLNQGLLADNTLTYASVYANGMLGAWVYVSMTKDRKRNRAEGAFFTAAALACIWVFKILCEHRMTYSSGLKWQVDYRYLLSLVFLVFLVSTVMASGWFRVIWDNRVMKFLAGISFNMFICHQYIAVKLKDMRVPPWDGEMPPNQIGDTGWQWRYLILCIAATFAVAVVMTYLVERPAAKLIKNIYARHRSDSHD